MSSPHRLPEQETGSSATHHRPPAADLALLFAASRLALLIVGLVATGVMASGLEVQRGNLAYHDPAPLPLEIWARWDAEWYLLIAAEGYDAEEHFARYTVPYEREATAGFLPLYPLLIRLLSPLLGGLLAGVLISNACLAGTLVLLHRLVALETPGPSGHRAGLAACAALLVFPTSLFLSAVYAESLFLLLSLVVFERIRHGRFAAAGLAGALAALTRPAGVLLVIPILVEWWSRRHEQGRLRRWGWSAALGPPAGLGLFMFWCAQVFGDPLAFFHRQQRWRGAMSGPWRAFTRWWEEIPAIHGAHDSTLELAIALVLVGSLPFLFRRLRPSYALYATAAILLPLCATLWSFGRFALTIFPFFMLIGSGWARRREGRWSRRLVILYGFAGATLSGLLMALFATGWWAG